MGSILLELHVPSFEPVKWFYSQLNFDVAWEHKPEGRKGYLVMELENNLLCFWSGNSETLSHRYFSQFGTSAPRGVGVEIVIQVKDLLSYFDQVRTKVEIFEPLQLKPWGLEDFRVVDPNGYYLRITNEFDIKDIGYAGRERNH